MAPGRAQQAGSRRSRGNSQKMRPAFVPFRKPAVLRQDAQLQLDLVNGRMAFPQRNSLLVMQFPQDASDRWPELVLQRLAPAYKPGTEDLQDCGSIAGAPRS